MVISTVSSDSYEKRNDASSHRFYQFPSLHLSSLLHRYDASSSSLRDWLTQREQCFGAATLCAQSLHLLLTLAEQQGVDVSRAIMHHDATVTAADTQAVLPAHVLVQKTLCLEIVNRNGETPQLVLLTGSGDFQLERVHRHVLAERLGCFHRAVKRAVINPSWIDPVITFGMLPGMVSPFLYGQEPPFTAVAILVAPPSSHITHVAISLSLFESLLLPEAAFFPTLHAYARRVFPQVRLIPLDRSSLPLELPPMQRAALTEATRVRTQ
jgi:hypothetical protein